MCDRCIGIFRNSGHEPIYRRNRALLPASIMRRELVLFRILKPQVAQCTVMGNTPQSMYTPPSIVPKRTKNLLPDIEIQNVFSMTFVRTTLCSRSFNVLNLQINDNGELGSNHRHPRYLQCGGSQLQSRACYLRYTSDLWDRI